MCPTATLSELWILLSLLPLNNLNIITTIVPFFDNCGVLLNFRSNDHYLLDINGLNFPQGTTVCHLAVTVEGKGDDGNGLLQCEMGSNSTVGEGVNIILRTYQPDSKRIYNTSHWISPNEKFEPAKRLVITVVRKDPNRLTPLHVTFNVHETVLADSPWSFTNSLGYILVGSALITCIGIGLTRCFKRANVGRDALDAMGNLRSGVIGIFSCCKAKAHNTERPVSSRGGVRNGSTTETSSVGLELSMSSVESLETPPLSRVSSADIASMSRNPSENNPNIYDSPPSYESCMASCNRNRPIFTLSSEIAACSCRDSPLETTDLPQDDLPPYSACSNIQPPSYLDSVSQQPAYTPVTVIHGVDL